MQDNRLDPSTMAEDELKVLSIALEQSGSVALVDEEGHRIELPAPLSQHLAYLVRFLTEKRTVISVPEDEAFTTQAAADYLGVSRQHLVNLLEAGRIPFYKVGAHRRIQFRDLLAYEKQRDDERQTGLDELMRQIDDAGLYDAAYTGADED